MEGDRSPELSTGRQSPEMCPVVGEDLSKVRRGAQEAQLGGSGPVFPHVMVLSPTTHSAAEPTLLKDKLVSDGSRLEWVTVRSRRKSGGLATSNSVMSPLLSSSPPAMSPYSSFNTSPLVKCEGCPAGQAPRPMPTLGDFVGPKLNSVLAGAGGPPPQVVGAKTALPAQGPSAMLSAAVLSVQASSNLCDVVSLGKASPWAAPVTLPEAPVSLREILEEEGSRCTRSVTDDSTKGATSCFWGRDVMPSEKPKGKSVYAIQEQEEAEKIQRREEDEIREIEAMFAALEVAENADALLESSAKGSSKAALAGAGGRARGHGVHNGRVSRQNLDANCSESVRWTIGRWTPMNGGRSKGRAGSWSCGSGWDWTDNSWSQPEGYQRWVPKDCTGGDKAAVPQSS